MVPKTIVSSVFHHTGIKNEDEVSRTHITPSVLRVSLSTMSTHRKYTKELLEPLVRESSSVAQVARRLGRPTSGGTVSHLKKTIQLLELDMSHFTGRTWNKGQRSKLRKTPEQILTAGYTRRAQAFQLRRAMIESGIEMKCTKCTMEPEWCGEPLVLEIDHINNDWTDNRLSNLAFMCSNCHTQKTTTDGAKAKFVKQLKASVVIIAIPTIEVKRKEDEEHQLKLNLSNWKPKKPRVSASDVNWRKLAKPHKRKVIRPSKDELETLIWEHPLTQLGLKFGITDNAVRRWCKDYGITNLPPLRYWARRRSGWSHEAALEPIKPRQPKKRLSDEQVIQIWSLLKDGKISQREIARRFDLDHSCITKIKLGQAYKHIKPPIE